MARGALAAGEEDEEGEDVRLCTTDGLMRTGCDPPAGTPLLLPLKRCQPPDCAVAAAGEALRLTLPAVDDGAEAIERGNPALGPAEVEPLLLKPRDAALAGAAVAERFTARFMAWRCWSNDT